MATNTRLLLFNHLTLAGYSLGGGIAIEMSLRFAKEKFNVVVFDTVIYDWSKAFKHCEHSNCNPASRVLISQKNESFQNDEIAELSRKTSFKWNHITTKENIFKTNFEDCPSDALGTCNHEINKMALHLLKRGSCNSDDLNKICNAMIECKTRPMRDGVYYPVPNVWDVEVVR